MRKREACQVHAQSCCGGFDPQPAWLRYHYRNMTLDKNLELRREREKDFTKLCRVRRLALRVYYKLVFVWTWITCCCYLHSIFNPTSSLCHSLFLYESQFCSWSHSYTPPVPANRCTRLFQPFVFCSPAQDLRRAKLFGTSILPFRFFFLCPNFESYICTAVTFREQ